MNDKDKRELQGLVSRAKEALKPILEKLPPGRRLAVMTMLTADFLKEVDSERRRLS